MNRKKILDLVVETLEFIQELSGRSVPRDVTERTVPIGGLPGFDSLNGLELTIMLPDEIKWGGKNLCVSDDGKKALSIGEVVDRLLETHNPSD